MNVTRPPVEYVLARCVLLDALDALGAHCAGQVGVAVLGFPSMAIELPAAQPDLIRPWWTMSSRN